MKFRIQAKKLLEDQYFAFIENFLSNHRVRGGNNLSPIERFVNENVRSPLDRDWVNLFCFFVHFSFYLMFFLFF